MLTVLAPAPPRHGLSFDHFAWGDRRQRPVSARTGISWQDFEKMQTYQKKQSGERRLDTPAWAVNNSLLQRVLICFMESRAQIKNPTGTLSERRDKAIAAVLEQRKERVSTLDKLNREYVSLCRDNAPRQRLKDMEIEIEALDSYLRYTEKDGGLATVASVVHGYYRLCLDSVGTADLVSMKPPFVRAIIFRLNETWRKMNGQPTDHKKRNASRRLRRLARLARQVAPPPVPRARLCWNHAHTMHADGFSTAQIAKALGVSFSEIWAYLIKERTGPRKRCRVR